MNRLSQELNQLRESGLSRELKSSSGIDFTSNDYLGFARHPALAQALLQALERSGRTGSGGSRLLGGNYPEHEELEAEAADFFQGESALYFNSGFDANMALFSTLPSRYAAIVLDERVHASAKEGARTSFAKKFVARHNDLESMESALRRARSAGARELFIAVESLYSMEGDKAPLAELAALARAYEATLVVDEAHATGVLGAGGRGLSEGLRDPKIITLHTCGKALGSFGALLVAPRVVKNYLIHKARPFLYSTALPPFMASVSLRALRLIQEEPWRRLRLNNLAQRAQALLSGSMTRWRIGGGQTQIIPIFIGDEWETLKAAQELQNQGFNVRAIRTPTVPQGSSRLRISLNVERTEDEILALAETLNEL